MNCIICNNPCPGTSEERYVVLRAVTCSKECHEELVRRFEEVCGKFKKVVRTATGEAFCVPMRNIIEFGIKEQELDKYPRWPSEN